MTKEKHGHGNLTRRELFRTAGVATLGGLALSLAPRLGGLAHEGEGGADIKIHLGEMYFQVHEIDGEEVDAEKNAPIRIEAGERHLIRFENEGQVEHEVHFGRNPDLEARFYQENLFGPGGDHAAHGWMGLHLKPGESATIHVWIPEAQKGEWEIGCFMPGHYEAGQKAPFIVE
jgi:uncharacterized cupredoxin-like copper-binding protein